ncbi:MAG: hypothetical protein ABL876_00100 [Chitinophagaceae bacterium]
MSEDGYDTWNPEEMFSQLKLECDAMDIGDPIETAKSLILDNLPAAAKSIVHLAIHSKDERVRLRAAQYIFDKSVTNVADDPMTTALKQMMN